MKETIWITIVSKRICIFSVWPLPKVENWVWKQIWKEGGGAKFITKKVLKKPNTPKYAQVLVVMWAKPNSVTTLLSPPKYRHSTYFVCCLILQVGLYFRYCFLSNPRMATKLYLHWSLGRTYICSALSFRALQCSATQCSAL